MSIMKIYDESELLHMAAAKQAQRDKYILRWLADGHNPLERKRFGRQVETAIVERLRAAGYFVTRAGANEHYDILINGLRCEIKAASYSGRHYEAALRSNEADVLILCCRADRDCFFVIPFDQVKGRASIKISQADPAAYRGRLSAWLEAWQLIDQLIARGVNHWQPALL